MYDISRKQSTHQVVVYELGSNIYKKNYMINYHKLDWICHYVIIASLTDKFNYT